MTNDLVKKLNNLGTEKRNALNSIMREKKDALAQAEKKYNDAVILCSQILQFFPTDKFYLKLIIDLLC